MAGALQEIRIVDLTQHLAGPFCTMLLADMGAEVIKVEPPWGDASRSSPQYPMVKGQNVYFMFVNRNKRSVALDLKSEKGVEVLKRIVESSDVVVENFRPGVMDKLGLGYDSLKQVNPRIIYASISGFGQTGPYVRRPSFDIVAQAMSGWMWLNSREPRSLNSGPSFVPSCLAGSPGDTVPGVFCALSILAALLHRNITGRGQRIDVAQTDSLMTLEGLALTRYLFTGETFDRGERASIHGIYEANDGYIVVRAVGDNDVQVLADNTGIEIGDLRPSSEDLKEWFRNRSKAEIVTLLGEKIPCAPVLTDEELVDDPNVVAREMILEQSHPLDFTYRAVATGIKFSETTVSMYTLPPELGADTLDIVRGLSYSDEDVENMIKCKAIFVPRK